MVSTVMSRCGDLKILADNNYIDLIEKTVINYWKCEIRERKARLHTILENDNILIGLQILR